MKKLLLPLVALAMAAVPIVSHAEECRNSANGKFAKCGTAGAVPVSQYVKHGTSKKSAAKPSMMSRMMAKPSATPTTAAPMMAKPMMAKPMTSATPAAAMSAKPMKAKTVRCKNGNKFAKCGTPGAVPVG